MKKWKNIVWMCQPYWKYGKVYVLLSLLFFVGFAPLNDIVYVYSPEIIVNLLYQGSGFSYIALIALVLAGVSSLYNVVPRFFSPYFTRKQTQIDFKVKRKIYEKACKTDYMYVDNPEYYNDYAWALNEYVKQTNRTFSFAKRFFGSFFSIVALGSIVITIGPWLLVIEVIQLLLQRVLVAKRNKINIKMKEDLIPIDRRISYYHRLFYLKDYSADIRTTPLKDVAFNGFDEIGKEQVDIKYKYAKITAIITILQESLFIMTEFCIILYLAYSIIIGNIGEIGLYITMLLSFYRLDSKLYEFIQLIEELDDISMNVDRVQKFFETKSYIESEKSKGKSVQFENNFAIQLKNVGFSYENSDFSLSELCLDIRSGEKVAIVGENGAGKSTLINLLMRLYDVSTGDILINGISIKDYEVQDLRKHIGVAFQKSNVYAMSFSDNITLYGKAPVDVINSISQDFELNYILDKNNAGYNSELTREFYKNGIVLSGGEVQKIALARLMTKKWGLLLLDEPSSALDPIAEYKMNKLILSTANQATTIIVAHRLSTIRNVDKIVVLDRGQILEIGTHDELMKKQGKYFEMFSKQAENYEI